MFKKFGCSKFVFQKCNQRRDEFADFVQGRLQVYIDLVAEEAV